LDSSQIVIDSANGTVDRVRTDDQPLVKTFLSTSVQPIVRDLVRRQTIATGSEHNPTRVRAPEQIHNESTPHPRTGNLRTLRAHATVI
jgi:hypothetical protein